MPLKFTQKVTQWNLHPNNVFIITFSLQTSLGAIGLSANVQKTNNVYASKMSGNISLSFLLP